MVVCLAVVCLVLEDPVAFLALEDLLLAATTTLDLRLKRSIKFVASRSQGQLLSSYDGVWCHDGPLGMA